MQSPSSVEGHSKLRGMNFTDQPGICIPGELDQVFATKPWW